MNIETLSPKITGLIQRVLPLDMFTNDLFEKQMFWNCLALAYFVLMILIYLRRRKLKVDCWFCGMKSSISKADQSWWFCSSCEQFNGFDEDGDYKREIPDMFSTANSCPRFCQISKDKQTQRNIMCDQCQRNQLVKMEKLRAFEPVDERTFEWEAMEYEGYLNERYGLCAICRLSFKDEINQQNTQIREMYSEEFEKQKPKSRLRKLKRKKNGFTIIRNYRKLLPLLLFLLSLLPLNIYKWNLEMEMKEMLLLVTSGTALVFNIILFLKRSRFHWLQAVSFVLWSNLLFNTYKKRSVKTPLTLKMTTGVELASFVLQCVRYIYRKWKERKYIKGRKSKLDRLTPNKSRGFLDDSTITSFESDLGSEYTADAKSVDLSPERGRAVITPHTNNRVVGNVVMETNIFETRSRDPSPERNQPTMTYVGESSKANNVDKRKDAPDLLQGHLNDMFIGRKRDNTQTSTRDASANHVVAALKYNKVRRTESMPSLAKQPLIRPATFLYSGSSRSETTEMERNNNEIVCKREQPVTNDSNINEVVSQRETLRPDPDFLVSQQRETISNLQTDSLGSQFVETDQKTAKTFPWKFVFMTIFLLSVVVNGVFCTFLYVKNENLLNFF
ncbi:uncharacterized protein [Clytia hemisphaerica]